MNNNEEKVQNKINEEEISEEQQIIEENKENEIEVNIESDNTASEDASENDKEEVKVVFEHHEMKKSFTERMLSIFTVVIICAICFMGGMLIERSHSGRKNIQKLGRIEQLIDENYYFKDDINHDKASENAIDAYVATLGDPFTYYLDEEFLKEFNESVTGGYVGIGVSVTTDSEGYVTITECFKGGSAAENGVLPGYKIIEVEGESVVGEKVDDVVAKIKGQEGEKVKVTFLTGFDEKKEIELTRKAVTINTVSSKIVDENIGYIKISSFDLMTGTEFKEHIEKIKNKDLKGLIIDLRNNGGGLLDSVVEVSDYLMPKSTIVTIKNRNSKDEIYESDENYIDIPIVCLINEYTASAAELLSGGLKVNNNAVLVGEKSYGKGVVGTQFYVDSKTAMVITTGEYFLPDGTNIHKKGIEPDVKVEIDESKVNLYLLNENDDIQLKQAIEELK